MNRSVNGAFLEVKDRSCVDVKTTTAVRTMAQGPDVDFKGRLYPVEANSALQAVGRAAATGDRSPEEEAMFKIVATKRAFPVPDGGLSIFGEFFPRDFHNVHPSRRSFLFFPSWQSQEWMGQRPLLIFI